jgi:hypothetical protein
MHLACRRRDHHVVGIRERAPAREGLAVGGQGERHRAADLLGVGGDAHREEAVERERIGPAQRLQPLLGRHTLDLRQRDLALVGAPERLPALGARQLPGEHGDPLGAGVALQRALGRDVGRGRAEVEEEGGRVSRG